MSRKKTKYNHDESRVKIEKRIVSYKLKLEELENELKANGYNENILRQQRNIKMHITTCEKRLNGEWVEDSAEINLNELLQWTN